MLGDGWLLKTERYDNVAHGTLVESEEREDFSATRFGNGVECVGGGGSASHDENIYLYGNMSRDFLGRGEGVDAATSRSRPDFTVQGERYLTLRGLRGLGQAPKSPKVAARKKRKGTNSAV
jgi:hypothetical protein